MNFEAAFTELLKNEGGYSDNPADPGGKTMYGITEAVARRYGYTGDMRALPLGLAKTIAQHEYWAPSGCDAVPDVLKFQLFELGYNGGPERARRVLQAAAGTPPDGVIGPATLTAVGLMSPATLYVRFCARQLLFYAQLSTWPEFGKGWVNRIAGNMSRIIL